MGACSIGAQEKTSNQPPAGEMQPLPVPSQPWSHIAIDFVNGLPHSKGKTTILTIVDRFSKTAYFVALSKLPSVAETAKLMIKHVFRLHGLPQDIVSDRGPQFVSQVLVVLLPASPQGSTPKPTAKRRGPIKTWRPLFTVSAPAASPPVARTLSGLSMHTIHSPPLPSV